MRSKRNDEGPGQARSWVLVCDEGDEAMAARLELARRERLAGGHFTAIGELSRATLGFFWVRAPGTIRPSKPLTYSQIRWNI